MTKYDAITQEQATAQSRARRSLRIGFPGVNRREHTFPLTPESAAILIDRGYGVVVEKGAGEIIHYTDEAYSRCGTTVAERNATLECDIVVSLQPLTAAEVTRMKRGAILLTLTNKGKADSAAVEALVKGYIHAIDLNAVADREGHHPFADIMTEIDGRAAMTVASRMLADPNHGKGIIIGGVTGVIACEVVILGSDLGARTAAASALAMGAIVRMLDDDPYGLREASQTLGGAVATSSLQPHVLSNLLRSADIVIASGVATPHIVDSAAVALMKKEAIVMDLSADVNPSFPSLPTLAAVDTLSPKEGVRWGGRVCYTSPGRTVPRSAAMAISNTLLEIMRCIAPSDGDLNPLKMSPGVVAATCTLRGKVVNPEYARAMGIRPFDINLLLSCL